MIQSLKNAPVSLHKVYHTFCALCVGSVQNMRNKTFRFHQEPTLAKCFRYSLTIPLLCENKIRPERDPSVCEKLVSRFNLITYEKNKSTSGMRPRSFAKCFRYSLTIPLLCENKIRPERDPAGGKPPRTRVKGVFIFAFLIVCLKNIRSSEPFY